MKKLLLTLAAASTLASTAVIAQPYGAYPRGYYERDYRDSDRDGRPDRREWNRDRDRDGRPDQYDRYDNRRGAHVRHRFYGPGYGYDGYRGAWRAGQRYPYYRSQRYIIRDYGSYGLPPPRRGYRYYRTDDGDVVMAAIATGIIGLIIGQALGDRDDRDRRYSR